MTTTIKFKCPLCGGNSYTAESDGLRHCNGLQDARAAMSCPHRWGIDQDWQFFILEVIFSSEVLLQLTFSEPILTRKNS